MKDRNYLHRPADVELTRSALHLVQAAHRCGIPVAVVTNQSGIDRGMFGWEDFFAVEVENDRQLAMYDEAIDLKIAYPFHPDHTPGYDAAKDGWRKPGSKMAEHACRTLRLDPKRHGWSATRPATSEPQRQPI